MLARQLRTAFTRQPHRLAVRSLTTPPPPHSPTTPPLDPLHNADPSQTDLESSLEDHAVRVANLLTSGKYTKILNKGYLTEPDIVRTSFQGRALHPPVYLPKTHGVPVASIHFRSHQKDLLRLYTHFVSHAAWALGIPISKTVMLPTQRRLWTVPRSPFVHKKSQENFERRTHKRAIKAWDADGEVVERWLQYIQVHPLPGVGMRVTRWHRVEVGIGKGHRFDEKTDRQLVEEVAQKIIEVETRAVKASRNTTQEKQ